MSYVCRMCGRTWANPSLKPCACWWAVRILASPSDEFVCARCGTAWPENRKGCNCWPNGIRVLRREAGDQGFPLPGI